jgi:hypothetical protein
MRQYENRTGTNVQVEAGVTDAQLIDVYGIAARFRLHLRCDCCLVDSERIVDVPAVEEAPDDIDSLLESGFMARQRFQCSKCEGPIATLVGVTQFRRRDAA